MLDFLRPTLFVFSSVAFVVLTYAMRFFVAASSRNVLLREDSVDDVRFFHARQPLIQPLESIGKALVVDA